MHSNRDKLLIFLSAVYLNQLDYVRKHKDDINYTTQFKFSFGKRNVFDWLHQLCIQKYYMDLTHELYKSGLASPYDVNELFVESKGPSKRMLGLLGHTIHVPRL